MLLTAPKDPNNAVEPSLFNLVDLALNSVSSANSQTAFAGLKLVATIMEKHKSYAFGKLLKVHKVKSITPSRTIGSLDLECEKYFELANSLHHHHTTDGTYSSLCDDLREVVEAQIPFHTSSTYAPGAYRLDGDGSLLCSAKQLLRTFFTNSVDVNLALTQAINSILSCAELRLDGWLAVDPSSYNFTDVDPGPRRTWSMHLDEDESEAWSALHQARRRPLWSEDATPALYATLQDLVSEMNAVRTTVPNLDQLVAGRKTMLQIGGLDAPISELPSLTSSPAQSSLLEAFQHSKGHRRGSSTSSLGKGRKKATDKAASPQFNDSLATSPRRHRSVHEANISSPPRRSIFQPPPPETPSTTDVLMQQIKLPMVDANQDQAARSPPDTQRSSSLNHVLTNIVVLQGFVLELTALLQTRAAVLGDSEVSYG